MSLGAYTKPFTQLSWIGIFMTILMISPVVAMVVCYAGDTNGFRFQKWYSFVSQALILRVGHEMPINNASRIIVGTILFSGIVVYQCWEASLESMLAIKKADPPFQTLQELSKDSDYNLFTAKGTVYVDHFRYSKDPLYNKIWDEKMKPYVNEFPSYGELFEYAIDNPQTIIYGDSYSKQNELYHTCRIISLGHVVRASQLAWAIQKGSPFAEAFYYNINKLKEIGVIQKYVRAHSQIKQRCDLHGGDPIKMKQCVSAFFLLIGGVCTGLVLFVIELCMPYKFVNWIYDVKSTSYMIPIERKTKAQKTPPELSLFSLKDRKKIRRYRYNKIKKDRKRNSLLLKKLFE